MLIVERLEQEYVNTKWSETQRTSLSVNNKFLSSAVYERTYPDCGKRMLARLVEALLRDLITFFPLSQIIAVPQNSPSALQNMAILFDKTEILPFNKKNTIERVHIYEETMEGN